MPSFLWKWHPDFNSGLVALHGLLKNVDASAFPSSMKMMLNAIFSHASVRVLDRMSEK